MALIQQIKIDHHLSVSPVGMSSSWQSMCVTSAQRSMHEFDVINYWTTGILVCCFIATGTACARRCWQWMWLSPVAKTELWELYGTFCLMGTSSFPSRIEHM
jgi:hypothetical protein